MQQWLESRLRWHEANPPVYSSLRESLTTLILNRGENLFMVGLATRASNDHIYKVKGGYELHG